MRPLNVAVISVLGLILSACQPKVVSDIVSQSPDKGITVAISALRTMPADPWRVSLNVKAYALKESRITFEVYGKLNEQNVRFDWVDNNHCTITVPDRNEIPRTFGLVADSTQVSVKEI